MVEEQTIHQNRDTRKTRMSCSWLSTVLALVLALFLTACGGGGGGGGGTEAEQKNIVIPPPTVRTAKLTLGVKRIDNSAANKIGTCDVDLVLPTGFVLPTDSGGYPTSATSLVTGLDIVNGITYSHPTLTLRLMMGDGTTFASGDLVSFSRTMESGETLPTISNFDLSNFSVWSGQDMLTLVDMASLYEPTLTIEEI